MINNLDRQFPFNINSVGVNKFEAPTIIELLNDYFNKIIEVVTQSNATEQKVNDNKLYIDDVKQQTLDFMNWVKDTGIPDETLKLLNLWFNNGTLEILINQTILSNINSKLEVERSRITNLATLSDGSTTGDAELIDGRVGADGVTYANIGGAIRGQISSVTEVVYKPSVNIFNSNLFNNATVTGITITYDTETGYLTLNGICTGVGAFWVDLPTPVSTQVTATCKMVSGSLTGSDIQFDYYDSNNNAVTYAYMTNGVASYEHSLTITDKTLTKARIYVKNGAIVNNLVIALQLENGGVASAFSKYGSKIKNVVTTDEIVNYTTKNEIIVTDAKQDLGIITKGGVVICVDDGTEYDQTNIWGLISQYNIPVVFALMKECYVCQNLLTEVKNLVATYNCEICQHGSDTMSSWSVSKVNNYLKEQIDFFTLNGITIGSFVAPQNETSVNMRNVGQNYFDLMFSEFPNKNGVTIENKMRTNRYKLSRTSITPAYGTAHYFPRMLRTKTEGLLYVMYVHSVALNDNTYVQLLRDIIEYAQNNSIAITTFRKFLADNS